MKLATYQDARGVRRIGRVDPAAGSLLDLQRAHELVHGRPSPHLTDMLALIDGGEKALDLARSLDAAAPEPAEAPLASVRLLAPLPEPRQMRDCLVFEEHLKNCFERMEAMTGRRTEVPDVWYRQPIYYKSNRFSVVGPDAEIRWPSYSNLMDFELELACVIGRTGVDIPKERAFEHVFGYTIFNDFTARDAQLAEMAGQLGPAKGKDFDTGNVLGPWIVTRDEIGDSPALDMVARINGERWGGGNSRSMHHGFDDILAFISRSETLHAGEVIGSGTVGTGCGLELGRFLNPGDVIELEVERIGVLRNRLVKP